MTTPSILDYDIPSNSGIRNPSRRLRRFAIRINGSCWIIYEKDVSWNLLNNMKEKGANWHLVRFDPAEAKKMIAWATESLRKEIEASIRRIRQAEDRAARRVEDEDDGFDHADYLRRIREAVRRANRLLAELNEAAGNFGIDLEGVMGNARTALDAVQQASHKKAERYAELAKRVAKIDEGMGNAAADDKVPVGVLADFLEDRGEDMGETRDLFSDTPTQEPAGEICPLCGELMGDEDGLCHDACANAENHADELVDAVS